MAYEHVRHGICTKDEINISGKGAFVCLDFDGDTHVIEDTHGIQQVTAYPDSVNLTVLGADPGGVREQLSDLVEQIREDFVIAAMDKFGCGTADLVVFEFPRNAKSQWLDSVGPFPFIQTVERIFSQTRTITLAAARKTDGPFEIVAFRLSPFKTRILDVSMKSSALTR